MTRDKRNDAGESFEEFPDLQSVVVKDHFFGDAMSVTVSEHGTVQVQVLGRDGKGHRMFLSKEAMDQVVVAYQKMAAGLDRDKLVGLDIEVIGVEEAARVEEDWTESEVDTIFKLCSLVNQAPVQFGPKMSVTRRP